MLPFSILKEKVIARCFRDSRILAEVAAKLNCRPEEVVAKVEKLILRTARAEGDLKEYRRKSGKENL